MHAKEKTLQFLGNCIPYMEGRVSFLPPKPKDAVDHAERGKGSIFGMAAEPGAKTIKVIGLSLGVFGQIM